MATGSLVSIEEYLHTTYRPDCDYVDGVVQERNFGEYDHAKLQTAIAASYDNHSEEWGIDVVTEQRVQVAATRFRVPDVCVALCSAAPQQIFRTPPFICIEILSKDDRLSDLQDRIDDYLNFGVPYVWLLDPARRKAFRCTSDGMHEVTELRTTDPDTVLAVGALFKRLRSSR